MPIVFKKDISETNLLFAHNNNVIRLYSDSGIAAAKLDVTFQSVLKTIYPDPNGFFYFNFKDLFSTLININNYADNLVTDLPTAYIYNWTNETLINSDIDFVLTLANDTEETAVKNIFILNAYLNLQDYKQTYPIAESTTFLKLLKPVTKLKYWNGYPFDFTLYVKDSLDITILNESNLTHADFTDLNLVNRIAISDGDTNETLEDLIPLQTGINKIKVSTFTNDLYFNIEKIIPNCTDGHYIKYINSFGGWSYWLFHKGDVSRTTKNKGQLNNDFNNLEDTISPSLNLGFESQDLLSVTSDVLTQEDFNILVDVLESTKVYLFTGDPFSKNNTFDWLEVIVKNGNYSIQNAKQQNYLIDLQIEIPERVTRRL